MKLKIIEFDEKYLKDFIYDGVEKEVALNFNIKDLAKAYAKDGDAYMAIVDDKLIAMAGIYKFIEGVGQVWMFFNREAAYYAKTIVEAINYYIKTIMEKNNYHRIQTICPKGSISANRFIKFFGFQEEGIMRQFANGQDFVMYAKLGGN